MSACDYPLSLNPAYQPSQSAIRFESKMFTFQQDGDHGQPDKYTILGTCHWAEIDGRIHIYDVNARAIGLSDQPETVAEDCRAWLESEFGEKLIFE